MGTMERDFIVKMARIRSGHVRNPAYMHRIGLQATPLCEYGEYEDSVNM